MSHIECRHCKTRNHYSGFGCGGPFGGMSAYTICDDCDRTLECTMDFEGMVQEGEGFQDKVNAAIEAQFAPGGQPIKATKTQINGILFVSHAAHLPDGSKP